MRILHVFLFLLTTLTGFSQVDNLEHLDFGNVGFQQIGIEGYEFKQSGINLFSTQKVESNTWKEPRQLIVSLDSNAYSEIDFNLGNKATQQIAFDIYRPISKRTVLELGVYRASNPGWMSRSFVRKTDLSGKIVSELTKRITLHANAGIQVVDLEQNGGFLDSVDYSLINDGQGGLELLSNVFLDQAYTRHAVQSINSGLNFKLVNRQHIKLLGDLDLGFENQSFRYVDDNPDSSYYAHFGVNALPVFGDSIFLTGFNVRPSITVITSDTSGFSRSHLTIGLNQNWNWLTYNNDQGRPSNQNLFVSGALKKKKVMIYAYAEAYLAGYNRGDFSGRLKGLYNVFGTDTSNRSIVAEFGIRQDATSPYTMERDAFSSIKRNWNELGQEHHTKLNARLLSSMGKWTIIPEISYDILQNLIYFDRFANINQNTSIITLFTGGLGFEFKGEAIQFGSRTLYQWNNRARLYALPEWVNTAYLQTRWPIFKKKVNLVPSVQSLYYSGFYVRGYIPFFQSRYVQVNDRYSDYHQLDASISLEIKTAVVGIRASNLLYGVVNDNPIIAPFYPSVPRYFSLHVNWRFRN